MFLILHNGIFMNVHYMFDIHVAVKMYACIAFNLLYRTQMYKFCLLWYCSGVVTCVLIDSSYSLLCKFFFLQGPWLFIFWIIYFSFIVSFFPLFCTFSIKKIISCFDDWLIMWCFVSHSFENFTHRETSPYMYWRLIGCKLKAYLFRLWHSLWVDFYLFCL